ncbi:MAG TPA: permease [Actinomycetota bacterium]|nr:permease [Actinomycetota bacterium]
MAISQPISVPRARAWRNAVLALAAVVAAAFAIRLLEGVGVGAFQNFVLVFASLLVEALPFVLLGALVAAAIEVFVPTRFFTRLAAVPRPLQMPVAGLGGFVFPVCECGSVPVTRRLVTKGLTPAAALTFMLAAPILNPIVLVSTAIAYRGRDVVWAMVGGRAVLGLGAAMVVGWILGGRSRTELLKAREEDHVGRACACEHCGGAHEGPPRGARARARGFFSLASQDFTLLARFLVIGAALASALQTFLPQSFLSAVATTPLVNLVAMMALAAVLSLCSSSDAFVAASFVQFGPAPQLAFLVFGPMVDAKLGFLYAGTFSKGFVRTVIAGVAIVTLVGTLWMQVMIG